MVESPEDQERCNKWIEAKALTCEMKGMCKVNMKHDKQMCSAQLKYFMTGVWKDEIQVPEAITSQAIGNCFTEALNAVDECAEEADAAMDEAMAGVEPPTEQEIEAFKKAMKEQFKNKRQQNKRNRKNKRKNKRNQWQKKNQWRKKKQWEREDESGPEGSEMEDGGPADDQIIFEEGELDGLN